MQSRLAPVLIVSLALGIPLTARADDGQGRFAIKGIGAYPCKTYLEERKKGGENAYMFGGWIYGYLTASNQFQSDTFDLAPWENLDTLALYLDSYCQANPDTSFAQAMFNMTRALTDARLKTPSNPQQIGNAERQLVVYQEVVQRVQQKLTELAHFKGEANGIYDEATRDALNTYQSANQLEVTGLPDQPTLHKLLRP